jgi:hypothetical protein
MKKLNENVAYAKSILNKLGITQDNPEWQDFVKIREICGNNTGYIGILTRLRFSDGVNDFEELESIFDVLKNSKIDVSKLLKMSYQEILYQFYDELHTDDDKNEDFELIYKDETYSYYRVYTYNGILKIGSPSWCLKTKSHWDNYQQKYPEQWVVISNEYKNKLLSPENNYLDNYSNRRKPWIRYGFSFKNNGGTISWLGNNDNNGEIKPDPKSYTAFGVLCTTINLSNGIKKSYYEKFIGCTELKEGANSVWHKVTDFEPFLKRMNMQSFSDISGDDHGLYVNLNKSYGYIPVMLLLSDTLFVGIFPTNSKDKDDYLKYVNLTKYTVNTVILDYIKDKDDYLFDGIKLAYGLITEEEIIKNRKKFVGKYDKWLIYDRNENYYLVVNTDVGEEFGIPSRTFMGFNDANYIKNPMFFYINKNTMRPIITKEVTIEDHHQKVINYIKEVILDGRFEETPKEPEKKVDGFLDFFKRRKG